MKGVATITGLLFVALATGALGQAPRAYPSSAMSSAPVGTSGPAAAAAPMTSQEITQLLRKQSEEIRDLSQRLADVESELAAVRRGGAAGPRNTAKRYQ